MQFPRPSFLIPVLAALGCGGDIVASGSAGASGSAPTGGVGGARSAGSGGSAGAAGAAGIIAAAGEGGGGNAAGANAAGASGRGGDGPDAATAAPDAEGTSELAPAVMAVGYGGLRIVTFDGRTWTNRVVNNPKGGDDQDLIRAVGYVGGQWIGAGWKLFLSPDGRPGGWREIAERDVPLGWFDCVTEQAGKLVVKVIRADYGGQNGEAITSSDGGKTWRAASAATTCMRPDVVEIGGAKLRVRNGAVERSVDGATWTRAYSDPCCGIEALAAGQAAPP